MIHPLQQQGPPHLDCDFDNLRVYSAGDPSLLNHALLYTDKGPSYADALDCEKALSFAIVHHVNCMV